MDTYGFYVGQEFEAYQYLGAHPEGSGVVFRTFAPNISGITVVYEGHETPMHQIHDGNFYEAWIEGAKPGDPYEYRMYFPDGNHCDHCDPYGFGMELRPDHRSIIRDMGSYTFHDARWMRQRNDRKREALNIYELHAGSWRKPGDRPEDWYTYDELGELLIPYLKEAGYNYIEFLPLSEHPCDESWGYQNTGFFAPTSRYGTADQLKKMIDLLHQNDIGVILDYVPVHFAVDYYALARYDGSELYEYPNSDVGVSEWGSYNFMHSRGEVRSFLQSAANYWLKEYHFDGLRMDAISRIIYWQGDERRGVNGNAVDFLKVMNRGVKERNPGCILIAEDSTNFPNVTVSPDQGGLGFDYKWDMGWMHDTLSYFQTGPEYRPDQYHKLTFSMMYFYNEHYLLPLSHDEVVHGKATITQKMNGDYEGKFPQARAMYLYMMVHPGKKLNFMGNEIGQLREWDEKRQQDWDLRSYPVHDAFYRYMSELNHQYLLHPALWEGDYDQDGFLWVDCHQEAKSVYVIQRKSSREILVALFNFSAWPQEYELMGMKEKKDLPEILLNSEWTRFGGGQEEEDPGAVYHNGIFVLPPFSGMLVKP